MEIDESGKEESREGESGDRRNGKCHTGQSEQT